MNEKGQTHQAFSLIPACECFMIRFDAGATVSPHRSGLYGWQAGGRGRGGPRGRNPPQKTRVEAPSDTLHRHRHKERFITHTAYTGGKPSSSVSEISMQNLYAAAEKIKYICHFVPKPPSHLTCLMKLMLCLLCVLSHGSSE